MDDSTFAERMAYALLLHYWREGAELTQSAIADAVEMTQPGVQPWYDRTEPPSNYRVHGPLADVLAVPEAWLIHQKGEPPKPHIWKEWVQERRKRPLRSRDRPVAKPVSAAGGKAGKHRRPA